MSGAPLSLPAAALPLIFPFHLAVDRQLRITQLGPSLRRVCPQAQAGDALGALFRIRRPQIAPTFAAIAGQPRALFLLEAQRGRLLLKGQALALQQPEAIVFLCAPWITGLDQLGELGLSLADFAIHDPIADLMVLMQAQQTALRDTEQLAGQLAEQRAHLVAANRLLEHKVAEAEAVQSELCAAQSELRATNSRLSVLIESLHAGVLVEDERRRIVLANATFCQIFGIPGAPAALVGADCSQSAEQSGPLFADPQGFAGRVEAILEARRPAVGEELALRDGRTLERDYVPIFLDAAYAGHLWLYRDISARKHSEQALAQARDAALESSRLKSRFLATVSHELRTPLNGVIGMSELLLGTPLRDEQAGFVRTIDESAQALLAIINDILDYSKIEAGGLALDPVELATAELVGGVVDILRPRIAEKQLVVAVETGPDVPPVVRGDAGRLRQILLNLLGNAVKFTECGRVALRVERAAADQADSVALRFSVQDTGVGIPAALQPRLFQPFTQADGSVTRRYGGTGLGLAISRSLVELMGGDMGYESAEGQGTTFWFVVPLGLVEPALCRAEPRPRPPQGRLLAATGALSGHLLLVEDHPVNRQVVLHQLARLGLTADIAVDGRAALERLSQAPQRYQAVLMDCQMPEMDGLSCARAIRSLERERGGRVPIIAMTASALRSDRAACFAAGMDDFLSKPSRQRELAAVLARWLAPAAPGGPRPADFDGAVWADLQALYADDPAALDELVQTYCDEAERLLAALRAAAALADAAGLAGAAHALRGSSANLGLAPLVRLAAQLEACAEAADADAAARLMPALEAAYSAARRALAVRAPAA